MQSKLEIIFMVYHKATISILLVSHPYIQQNRGGREVIIDY